jgi:hypothetical protein
MIAKWAKAGLLVFFGIILLIYFENVMMELSPAFDRMLGGQAPFLSSMMSAIGWILIIWCFVDAGINVVMSFRESKLSLDDLGKKLDMIEKRIADQQMGAQLNRPMVVEQSGIGKMDMPQTPATADPRLAPVPPPPPA